MEKTYVDKKRRSFGSSPHVYEWDKNAGEG